MSRFDWLVEALSSPVTKREEGHRVRDGSVSAAACRAAGVSRSSLWARLHPERIDRAKKAAQARRWREHVVRPGWVAYCQAYRDRWPGSSPIGFGRWIKERHYAVWPSDPERVLRLNVRSRASAREAHDKVLAR